MYVCVCAYSLLRSFQNCWVMKSMYITHVFSKIMIIIIIILVRIHNHKEYVIHLDIHVWGKNNNNITH